MNITKLDEHLIGHEPDLTNGTREVYNGDVADYDNLQIVLKGLVSGSLVVSTANSVNGTFTVKRTITTDGSTIDDLTSLEDNFLRIESIDLVGDIDFTFIVKKKVSSSFNPEWFEGAIPVEYLAPNGKILYTDYVVVNADSTPPSCADCFIDDRLEFDYWVGDYTNVRHPLQIGAIYKTKDTNSHFDVRTTVVSGNDIIVTVTKANTQLMTINMGDGNEYTSSASGVVSFSHTFNSSDEHSCYINCGGEYSINENFIDNRDLLIKLFCGENISFIDLRSYVNLAMLTLSDSITSLGSLYFNGPLTIIFSRNISSYINMFSTPLNALIYNDLVATLTSYTINDVVITSNIIIPSNITLIKSISLRPDVGKLSNIYLPNHNTPPSLESATASLGVLSDSCIIWVKYGTKALYDVATNWTAYADYIKELPA